MPDALTAAQVKDALRRRHPAAMTGSMVGQWVCIEEWENIDLLALNAWAKADVIGYEVKVSRSDMRQDLLAPRKRADAVAMCTEFYFAVPQGLLRPEEIAFEEPDWQPKDWKRSRCRGLPRFGPVDERSHEYLVWQRRRDRGELGDDLTLLDVPPPPGRYGGECHGRGWTGTSKKRREKGPFTVRLPLPIGAHREVPDYLTHEWGRVEGPATSNGRYPTARVPLKGDALVREVTEWHLVRVREAERSVLCPVCNGKGHLDVSRVEAEAPTLWVPRDVGLIEITARGCRVTRRSPKRPQAPGLLPVTATHGSVPRARQRVHHLVRWTSNRPDPRHLPAPSTVELGAVA